MAGRHFAVVVCVVDIDFMRNNVVEIAAVVSVPSAYTFNYSGRTQSYCK